MKTNERKLKKTLLNLLDLKDMLKRNWNVIYRRNFWFCKYLKKKTKNGIKTNRDFYNHWTNKESFVFRKNMDIHKIKIGNSAFFNMHISALGLVCQPYFCLVIEALILTIG